MTTSGPIDLSGEVSRRSTVHINVGQEMVVITTDKLRLRLIEQRDCLADKKEWLTPLGLLLSFVATLAAADFHDFVFKAPVWDALFILGSIASGVWLVKAGWKAWSNRKLGSLDALIERIKPDATPGGQSSLGEAMTAAEITRKVGAALMQNPLSDAIEKERLRLKARPRDPDKA